MGAQQGLGASEVRRLGGILVFDDDGLDGLDSFYGIADALREGREARAWPRSGIARDLIRRVVAVDLRSTAVADTDLRALRSFSNLEMVGLPGTVTSRGLALLLDTPVRWVEYPAFAMDGKDGIRIGNKCLNTANVPLPGGFAMRLA